MTKYSKQMTERICSLIREDSYTIAEICRIVKINCDTYYHWKATKPEFSEAIKKAQDDFNELALVEAERSLMRLVRGYSIQEKRTVSTDSGRRDENGKAIAKVKEHIVTDKHVQPVPAAVIFTLINRAPDKWKNRTDNKVTADVGFKSHLESLSDEELQKIIDGKEAGEP